MVFEAEHAGLLGGVQGFGGASKPSRPSYKKRALLVATHPPILRRLKTSAGRISAADVRSLLKVTAQVDGFNPDMADFGTGFINSRATQQSWSPSIIKNIDSLV